MPCFLSKVEHEASVLWDKTSLNKIKCTVLQIIISNIRECLVVSAGLRFVHVEKMVKMEAVLLPSIK